VVRNYELALRLRVLAELGDRRLDDIDLGDLLALKEQLLGEGHSGSTIRNSFVPLQAIYRRARRNGTAAINPTIDLGLPTAGTRERVATPGEAAELIEALPELERALWATAFYAGLRRGEMRGLRSRDVDLEAAVASVERGWDEKEGPIAPKSVAGTRRVFLLDALRPHLAPLLDRDGDPDDLLFGYGGAAPFDPRAVARKAQRAWAAANKERAEADLSPLPAFTFHEARHSFSTWLDHAGVSPDRADRYMGHSTSSTVPGRYRHLLPGQMAKDAELLDEYLAGATAGKVVALAAAQ
jgi:integrase